ncbi:hypothetical protein, partial [Desertimonas flava]|uniref:hypothetical protein n=1 Tax=Desertimonas flava TaxID=2064846 RepID=UPI0023F29631
EIKGISEYSMDSLTMACISWNPKNRMNRNPVFSSISMSILPPPKEKSLRYFISRFSMWLANTALAAFSAIAPGDSSA